MTLNQSVAYEAIDNTKKADGIYSEIMSPSDTDTTNSQGKVEEFTLSQCPAYVYVITSSSAISRSDEDVKIKCIRVI